MPEKSRRTIKEIVAEARKQQKLPELVESLRKEISKAKMGKEEIREAFNEIPKDRLEGYKAAVKELGIEPTPENIVTFYMQERPSTAEMLLSNARTLEISQEAISTARSIEDSLSRSYALSEIAKAQASAGMAKESESTFKEAISTARSIEDINYRSSTLSEIAKAQASSMKPLEPLQYDKTSSILPSADYNLIRAIGMQIPLQDQEKALSAIADSAARKRAGEIMIAARTGLYHIYGVSGEEKQILFKRYSAEFKEHLTKGEEEEHYRLKLLARILHNLDLATGESSSFALVYDAAKSLPPESEKLNRLLYALAEMDSYKGKDLAVQMIGKGKLDGRVGWLLLNRLSEVKYLDTKLPAFYEKELSGLSGREKEERKTLLLDTTKKLISEIGVNPDSGILDFLLHGDVADEKGKKAKSADDRIRIAKEYKRQFDSMEDKDALVESLSKDATKAMFYFILNGGRTRFSLVNNYDSMKFNTAVRVASELKVHEGPLDEFMDLMADKAIKGRLLAGRFPVAEGKYSKEIRIDVSNSEELASIERFAASIFGKGQIGTILKAKHYINRLTELGEKGLAGKISKAGGLADVQAYLSEAEAEHPELIAEIETKFSSAWRKMAEKKLFSMTLHAGLTSDENKLSIKELINNLEIQRKALEFAVRQQYKSGAVDRLARDKRIEALQEKGRAKLLAYLLGETISGGKGLTELEDRLLSEWQSHLDQVFQSYERLDSAEVSRTKEKTVVLRYLDKKDDMIECLRFADSAQCCFNSKNYRTEGHDVGALEWIARTWKDPLSFVFQIEEPMAGETRNAIGFVFGSFGVQNGKPVVLLNGVYVEGKTKTAAQSILSAIENDFTRQLCCGMQFVASRHGGSVDTPSDYSNKQVTVKRLRAIRGSDGKPETEVYDDINVGANKEGKSDGSLWHKELQ